jgi:hypothetical protein
MRHMQSAVVISRTIIIATGSDKPIILILGDSTQPYESLAILVSLTRNLGFNGRKLNIVISTEVVQPFLVGALFSVLNSVAMPSKPLSHPMIEVSPSRHPCL